MYLEIGEVCLWFYKVFQQIFSSCQSTASCWTRLQEIKRGDTFPRYFWLAVQYLRDLSPSTKVYLLGISMVLIRIKAW
jgi:hypothetical protein